MWLSGGRSFQTEGTERAKAFCNSQEAGVLSEGSPRATWESRSGWQGGPGWMRPPGHCKHLGFCFVEDRKSLEELHDMTDILVRVEA